jgi:predicted ribosomally synthesized peptide with nif11-like leader
MTQEQLDSLVAKLKDDSALQEALKGAAGLDGFLAIVNGAGFNVSKADWLKHQARQTLALSDKELEALCCDYVSQYSTSCN